MACSDPIFNFSEFMNVWTFGSSPWTGDQPDARRLPNNHDNNNILTFNLELLLAFVGAILDAV
jgi:hypothetical protein